MSVENQEPEAREVSWEEARAEAQAEESGRPAPQTQADDIAQRNVFLERGGGQPPLTEEEIQQAEAERKQAEEDREILSPKTAPRTWTFGPDGQERTYIQYELSVTGSAQWFGLLGEVLEELMSGENPFSLNSLLEIPQPRGPQLTAGDFRDADMFLGALGKLLMQMPKFLEKSVCIWLAVPDYEWEFVAALMKLPPSKGGMSWETMEEILATFIDQNYAEIDRFFRVRSQRLRARWQARASEASQSPSLPH